MSFDWKKTLATVAPTIAGALGGPLAGVAASAGLKALGIETTGSPTEDQSLLSNAITGANPETLLRLKQADYDFKFTLSC